MAGVGRGGETEFTSTELPPRHSAPDCDIYPPSLHPTLCFCHPHISILPSRSPATLPADPTPRVDFLPTTHFTSTIPLRGLSLRRFPSTRSQPLFSPPLSATIALLPPFRNALGLRVGVERERKGRSDARVAGGRLSASLLLRRSMYMALLQEGSFFTSLFFLLFFFFLSRGWRVGIRRVREFGISPPTIHGA